MESQKANLSKPKRWCCECAALDMPANLENSAVATGLEKVSFIPILMKGNAKECSNYHTIALISHTSKLMLKILQVRLQQYMNWELPDVQAGCKKGRGTWVKFPTSVGSWKKQEHSRKILLLLHWLCQSLWLRGSNKLWNILKEMGIPDYLTCLLRSLYVAQEATVRTGHGTMGWFQTGKRARQGCVLSPAYLTYMQSTSCEMPRWRNHKLQSG